MSEVKELVGDLESQAWNCDEWPRWLHDLVVRTNDVADRLDMSSEQAMAYAVLAALIERLSAPVQGVSEAMVEQAMGVPRIPTRGPHVFDEKRMRTALEAALAASVASEPSAKLTEASLHEYEEPDGDNIFVHEYESRSALADAGEPVVKAIWRGDNTILYENSEVTVLAYDPADPSQRKACWIRHWPDKRDFPVYRSCDVTDLDIVSGDLSALSPGSEQLRRERDAAREALAFADKQAEKLEALLDPYISWEGQPSKLQAAETRAADLARDLEAAKEALEPFAKHCEELDALRHEDDSTCVRRLKASDIRRARATLDQLKGTDNG